jgi:hypothetical protein
MVYALAILWKIYRVYVILLYSHNCTPTFEKLTRISYALNINFILEPLLPNMKSQDSRDSIMMGWGLTPAIW